MPCKNRIGGWPARSSRASSIPISARNVVSFIAQSLDRIEARRAPRRIERRQERERERHHHHRRGLAGIEIGGKLGEKIELGREQLGIGKPPQEATYCIAIDAHEQG